MNPITGRYVMFQSININIAKTLIQTNNKIWNIRTITMIRTCHWGDKTMKTLWIGIQFKVRTVTVTIIVILWTQSLLQCWSVVLKKIVAWLVPPYFQQIHEERDHKQDDAFFPIVSIYFLVSFYSIVYKLIISIQHFVYIYLNFFFFNLSCRLNERVKEIYSEHSILWNS